MDPPLQRLDPPHRPMRNHRSTANLVIRLQPFNLPKEEVNLIPPVSLGIPTRPFHRGARSASRKRRRKVPNIKPHRLPVDDLITQFIRNILGFLSLTELQPSSPNYIDLRIIGMGFQMEEILKQIKVGLDPQTSLAKMDENRDVENRVRGQVIYQNPPMEKEAPEEIGNRKTEAPTNIRKENNRFVSLLMRKRLPLRSTLMDHTPC